MTESPGVVVRTEGEFAVVEAEAQAGCGRCDSVGGCSAGVLSRLFCSGPRQVRALNRIRARPGERVVLGVQEGALLRSAGLAYAWPLLLSLTGAMAGSSLAGDPVGRDLYGAAGAAAGLLAGLAAARVLGARSVADPRLQPEIVRRA